MDDLADPSLGTPIAVGAMDLVAAPAGRRPRRGPARTLISPGKVTGDASDAVLLCLHPSADGDTAGLRQQLALCLAAGITRIEVDVHELDGLDGPALQALQGVADYLRRRNGSLTVVGAGDRVLGATASRRLELLLPSAPADPVPTRPSRTPSPTSHVPAPGGTTTHSEPPR